MSLSALTNDYPVSPLPVEAPQTQRVINTWDGSSSTDWDTGTNWSLNHMPTSSEDVNVPSVLVNRYPAVNGNRLCNSLNIQSGASINIQNSTLTVSTSVNCYGNLRLTDAAAVLIIATDLQFQSSARLSVTAGLRPEIRVGNNLFFLMGSSVNAQGGRIRMNGTGTHYIYSDEPTTLFALTIACPNCIHDTNVIASDLTISDSLTVQSNCHFFSNTSGGTRLKGNVYVPQTVSSWQCNAGAVILEGGANTILTIPYPSYLNTLIVNKSAGTHASMGSNLTLKDDLTINSGALWAGMWDIAIQGDWTENVEDGFDGGVHTYFTGAATQYIFGTEHFEILDASNNGFFVVIGTGANVSCDIYHYHSGGLMIAGNFTVNSGDPFEGVVHLLSSASLVYNAGTAEVILSGYLYVSGTVTVNGGDSWTNASFPSGGTLNLNNGTMEFADISIVINSGYTLSSTDGTLRTAKNLTVNDPTFNPTDLTVDFYGSSSSQVYLVPGAHLGNLTVHKTGYNAVWAVNDLYVDGNLIVYSGGFTTNSQTVLVDGNVYVYGTMWVDDSAFLAITAGHYLNVYDGGFLSAMGNTEAFAHITIYGGPAYYAFNVFSGGSIAAQYASFSFVDAAGVNIHEGAYVSYRYAFHHCIFEQSPGSGTLLTLDNDQDLYVYKAYFSPNTWGGSSNVTKTVNQGSVHFISATGSYAGEAYDNDPYSRIEWTSAIPPVMDLDISYDGSNNMIHLDWDYPIPEATFTVYKCVLPYGTFMPYYTGVTETEADIAPGAKVFYQVTAVLP